MVSFVSPVMAYDIESYCRQVSDAVGGSYQIEKSCRDQEQRAKASLSEMEIPSRIDNYCEQVGDAVGGSYQIKKSCVEQEIRAKKSLY